MKLGQIIHNNVVVLSCSDNLGNAAHAMVNHNIGSVLIANQNSEPCGILTDRDLLYYLLSDECESSTNLSTIMTKKLIFADPDEDIQQAVAKMADSGIRRLPVIEKLPSGKTKVSGILTLDDLILKGVVDPAQLAEVVKSQVGFQSDRKRSSVMRSGGRREQTYNNFINQFAEKAQFDPGVAESVALCILGELCRRLTPTEANHLISQLPRNMHEALREVSNGPDKSISPEKIVSDVSNLIQADQRVGKEVTILFWKFLKEHVSKGEIIDIQCQLPKRFESIFAA